MKQPSQVLKNRWATELRDAWPRYPSIPAGIVVYYAEGPASTRNGWYKTTGKAAQLEGTEGFYLGAECTVNYTRWGTMAEVPLMRPVVVGQDEGFDLPTEDEGYLDQLADRMAGRRSYRVPA